MVWTAGKIVVKINLIKALKCLTEHVVMMLLKDGDGLNTKPPLLYDVSVTIGSRSKKNV